MKIREEGCFSPHRAIKRPSPQKTIHAGMDWLIRDGAVE